MLKYLLLTTFLGTISINAMEDTFGEDVKQLEKIYSKILINFENTLPKDLTSPIKQKQLVIAVENPNVMKNLIPLINDERKLPINELKVIVVDINSKSNIKETPDVVFVLSVNRNKSHFNEIEDVRRNYRELFPSVPIILIKGMQLEKYRDTENLKQTFLNRELPETLPGIQTTIKPWDKKFYYTSEEVFWFDVNNNDFIFTENTENEKQMNRLINYLKKDVIKEDVSLLNLTHNSFVNNLKKIDMLNSRFKTKLYQLEEKFVIKEPFSIIDKSHITNHTHIKSPSKQPGNPYATLPSSTNNNNNNISSNPSGSIKSKSINQPLKQRGNPYATLPSSTNNNNNISSNSSESIKPKVDRKDLPQKEELKGTDEKTNLNEQQANNNNIYSNSFSSTQPKINRSNLSEDLPVILEIDLDLITVLKYYKSTYPHSDFAKLDLDQSNKLLTRAHQLKKENNIDDGTALKQALKDLLKEKSEQVDVEPKLNSTQLQQNTSETSSSSLNNKSSNSIDIPKTSPTGLIGELEQTDKKKNKTPNTKINRKELINDLLNEDW